MIARSVIENIATALASNYKIQVIFRGSECHTNGKLIVLPSLPDTLPGPLVELLRGYLDHEVAHILFTDWYFVTRSKKKSAALGFVFNAVEDIRIEQKMATVYRGCRVNFDKSRDLIIEKLKDKFSSDADRYDSIDKTLIFFIFVAQVGWSHPFVDEYASDIMPLLEHLADEIESSKTLEDSKEAYELSKKILLKIETYKKPEPKPVKMSEMSEPKPEEMSEPKPEEMSGPEKMSGPEEPSEPKPEKMSGPEEPSEPKPEEPSEPKPEEMPGPEEPSEPKPEEPSEPKPEEPSEPKPEEPSGPKPEEMPEPGGTSETPEEPEIDPLEEKIKEALKSGKERSIPSLKDDIVDESKKLTNRWRAFSTKLDSFAPHAEGSISDYNKICLELNGAVNTLRGRLSRILLSQKRSKWAGNKQKGIINPSQLHQVIAKTSDSVFRTRKDGIKMNTAVSILVDLSSSMLSENKIDTARKTAALLAETLKSIGAPVEILGFSGDLRRSSVTVEDRKIFSRWGSLDMFYFKKFEEGFGQVQKSRIAGLKPHQQNYDGESILFAAARLQARPERKKILFVLSDGYPCACDCQSNDVLNAHLKSTVQELEKDPNMVVIGFGMKTDAVARFYKNHMVVDDLAAFPETLMVTLYKQLI